MQIIDILPHHAQFYFEAYYFGKSSREIIWNHNYRMKRNGRKAMKRVLKNPEQMVRIIRDYDEFCRMCPRNPNSANYSSDWRLCDDANKMKDSRGELMAAKLLGLEEVVDGLPITSRTFFQLMEPSYKRVAPQVEENPDKPILSLLIRTNFYQQ